MQYNPSFVMHRPILSQTERHSLGDLALRFPLDRFLSEARCFEEVAVDFVYTSAKIEGNTYDRVDTDNLLRLGITAGGKRYSDAIMLVNLRSGFERAMAIKAADSLDVDYICDLHQILMRDLLPPHEQGIVRTSGVAIGATAYKPPADPGRLRTEIAFIVSEVNKYSNPFEKAIYLHCNLAYLQYFRDGNKRTSRMIQTAALAQAGILPLFFSDTLIGNYLRATVEYYETGDYSPYVEFFMENYALSVANLLGDPLPALSIKESETLERRVAILPRLQEAGGAASILAQFAQEAISASGSAQSVNWADIERRVLVESISNRGYDAEGVGAILCKYSPGATTPEKQQAIMTDIKRLALTLRADEPKKDDEISCLHRRPHE